MCGICGIIKYKKTVDTDQLLSMTRVLRHRGPDDEGFILGDIEKNMMKSFHHDETIDSIRIRTPRLENDFNANLGFGFRRLSILDLSENGHQPMQFEDSDLWIVYNGEIYNYIEIREELRAKGYAFKSNTDTEVILKSYHEWGESCVHKFNGMWAFAIWDSKNRKLFCSRDRFGIKPFYYNYKQGVHFVFASEIKSILQVIKTEPDKQTLYDSFAYGYSDHNERTFYSDVKQLRGGHNLILQNGNLSFYRYYKIKSQPCKDSFDTAKIKLRELLFDAVRIRLRSDVPLGYALSGGIDSSSIVGIASKINQGSNNTFSMIYPGDSVDESFFINKVIEKTGVNHHFVSPTPDDFLNDLDRFIWHQEEPFIGTSYFGEFKLRQLIRSNNVTVSLEGQGADEIITGYTSLLLPYFFDLMSEFKFAKLVTEHKQFKNSVGSLRQLVKLFLIRGKKTSAEHLFKKYSYLDRDYFEDIAERSNEFEQFNSGSYLNDTLYEMLIYTSIPQQLVRADKNAMAFSVECRFPFLDYRLVEYAINLPFEYKTKNGLTKYILREAIKDLLPTEVYNRKDKIGFAIPNNSLITNKVKKFFLDFLTSSSDDDFLFLDKKVFLEKYYSKNDESDWKFWKTVSGVMWRHKFQNISSTKIN
ncbi:MAG: asparagine synthase (glutamine-hydrolyzing) [Ignavibacteriaceae bacterium]